MNRITSITILLLLGLLVASITGNFIQYAFRKPVIDTVYITDTLIRYDTIVHTVTNRVLVEKPVPVYVDTLTHVKTYRDTFYHQYGTIRREEQVLGELLRKDLEIDLQIPEITKTLTINTIHTNTIRRPLLFASTGLQSDFKGTSTPVVGAQYTTKDHRLNMSYSYLLSGQHQISIGYNIFR